MTVMIKRMFIGLLAVIVLIAIGIYSYTFYFQYRIAPADFDETILLKETFSVQGNKSVLVLFEDGTVTYTAEIPIVPEETSISGSASSEQIDAIKDLIRSNGNTVQKFDRELFMLYESDYQLETNVDGSYKIHTDTNQSLESAIEIVKSVITDK